MMNPDNSGSYSGRQTMAGRPASQAMPMPAASQTMPMSSCNCPVLSGNVPSWDKPMTQPAGAYPTVGVGGDPKAGGDCDCTD